MKVYLVGGAVRDQLLGLPMAERDWVVVGSSPEEMAAQGFRPVGKDFPVFLHPETHEQYALARTERKVGPGYKGFVFQAGRDVSLEEDLKRRDLTINAMAQTADGILIDPFGGADDLRAGLLRHVSTAFAEDPVRILRTARFAARFARWGFRVAHATNELMRTMVQAGEVDALVPERVWAETQKALAEQHPSRFFAVLHGCGALAKLFPEIAPLYGQLGEAHAPAQDVHAMQALEQAARLSPDPSVRFAALALNFGRDTREADEVAAGEAESLVRRLCARYKLPGDFQDLALVAVRTHGRCQRAVELDAPGLVQLLEDADAFRRPERFEQLLLACEADARVGTDNEREAYPPGGRLRAAYQAARGVDARALAAQGLTGVAIARGLRRLRAAAVAQRLRAR